ncbi:hypothetical protein Ancab_022235 [Ancistrocladus abbreviatus]
MQFKAVTTLSKGFLYRVLTYIMNIRWMIQVSILLALVLVDVIYLSLIRDHVNKSLVLPFFPSPNFCIELICQKGSKFFRYDSHCFFLLELDLLLSVNGYLMLFS